MVKILLTKFSTSCTNFWWVEWSRNY